MKENVMLTVASLLSVVLGTFHLTRDLLRNGMAELATILDFLTKAAAVSRVHRRP